MTANSLLHDLRGLAPRLADREAADPDRYPSESIADLQRAGVLTAPFPEALGGRGTALPELVSAIEVLAAASPSTALLLSMPLGLAGVYGLGGSVAPPEHRPVW